MTHSHVWREAFTCATWPVHIGITVGDVGDVGIDVSLWLLHMWHNPFTRATRLIHMCDMTHSHNSFTWHIHTSAQALPSVLLVLKYRYDSFICGTTNSSMRHDSFTCATWLIHTCDVTHSHVRHDSFISATWLIHICDRTHSSMRHDPFTCATWPIHMCDMTHSHVRHDSFIQLINTGITVSVNSVDVSLKTPSYVAQPIHT